MSLFANLPFALTAVLLSLVGAFIGAIINLGIYQLCYDRRLISPWYKTPENLPQRSWLCRVPIFGWLLLRNESSEFGKWHWIRPMLIELAWAVGLVVLYWWYDQGGLVSGNENISSPPPQTLAIWNSLWFLFHVTLFVLLSIATFIDFDERTIPDWITIPGTLFALAIAAVAPQTKLPTVQSDLVANAVSPLHYGSPLDLPGWHALQNGLWTGLAVIAIWCFALLPGLITTRFGLFKAIQIFIASKWPPRRKTKCNIRVRKRTPTSYHWIIAGVLISTCCFIWFIWQRGGTAWDSLASALLGMAFGGGLTWAVRIVATYAMRMEAMGFGDVTLMAMIGAFLGWQPALLIFGLAPFTSILVALGQLVTTRDPKIAFGPYLCIATGIIVLAWYRIWNEWAAQGIFSLGSWLIWIVCGSLLVGGVVLFIWASIKFRLFGEEEE